MMKSCKILNVARLLALALVAVLLIPACLPVAHAATATKLALLMEAEKYQYIEGDMFDPEGLVLRVTYDDGTTKNITEGFTFDERPLTLEDEEVKITYEGMTVVQEIQVASAADALIIRFGSGDCIRCYGNGTAIAGGTQMNSYIWVDGDDTSLANIVEGGMNIAYSACNVGTWSWDGETFTLVINNHTVDVVCYVTVDQATHTCVLDEPYPFVDYENRVYNFGGSADPAAVEAYLTPDRVWPVVHVDEVAE